MGDELALADHTNTITRFIAEGDTVAATLRVTGTHHGNFYGIAATGKDIDIATGAILRIEDGKIV